MAGETPALLCLRNILKMRPLASKKSDKHIILLLTLILQL
jgi:hypothetical protein